MSEEKKDAKTKPTNSTSNMISDYASKAVQGIYNLLKKYYLIDAVLVCLTFYVVMTEGIYYYFWKDEKVLGFTFIVLSLILKGVQYTYSSQFYKIDEKSSQLIDSIDERRKGLYDIFVKYKKSQQEPDAQPDKSVDQKLETKEDPNSMKEKITTVFGVDLLNKYSLVRSYTRKYRSIQKVTYLNENDQIEFDKLKGQYKVLAYGLYYDYNWFEAVLSVFFIPLVFIHYYLIEEIYDRESTTIMMSLFLVYLYLSLHGQYSLQFFPLKVSFSQKIGYKCLKFCELMSKVILTCLFLKVLMKGQSFNYRPLVYYTLFQTFQIVISSILFLNKDMRSYVVDKKQEKIKKWKDSQDLCSYMKFKHSFRRQDQYQYPLYVLINIYRSVFYLSYYEQPVFFNTLKNFNDWDEITDLPGYYWQCFSLFYYQRIRFTYYVWFLRIFENVNLILFLFRNIDILPALPSSLHSTQSKHIIDKLTDFQRYLDIFDYVLRNQQTHLFLAIILTLILFIYYLLAVLRKFNKDKEVEQYKDAYEED